MLKLGPFLIGSLALLVQQYADLFRREDLHKTLDELEDCLSLPNIETFDFIVVGAGTAGCLMASRLSEFFTVLLLETGGNPVPAESNPYLIAHVRLDPSINYIIPVVKQKHFALGMGGAPAITQGRMMGGSGSHNDNGYNRGSPHDYDYWAKVTGDSSWAYESILQHYKILENFEGWLVNESQRHEYYGSGGPWNVETDKPLALRAWLDAGRQLGYPIRDPNGYQEESFAPWVQSRRNGVRDSTYTAFIERIEATRRNLRVLRYSQVQEVLISEDKVAYGVTYMRHGIPQIAHASREVIMSAGAIHSPLMLMKSGIGPAKMLAKAGIPVKQDLSGVGHGLIEHPFAPLAFTATNLGGARDLFPLVTDNTVEEELIQFQSNPRAGGFTQTDGPQAILVSSRARSEGEGHWPDIQILYDSNLQNASSLIGWDTPQVIFLSTLTRPKSRGYVRLNTSAYSAGERDVTKLAVVNPGCLTEPSDLIPIIEGIKVIFRILEETTGFAVAQFRHDRSFLPACDVHPYRSDKYWACSTEYTSNYYVHFSASCKMGDSNDPLAVVDSKLRVRGIKNLRVADASVLPTPTNGNTNAPTAVTAQKGACEILMEHLAPNLDPLRGSCPFV